MRLLRSDLNDICPPEFDRDQLISRVLAHLDLNSIQERSPSRISFLACNAQLLSGLPVRNMEWTGANHASASAPLGDCILSTCEFYAQVWCRRVSLYDDRIVRWQDVPSRVRHS